MPRADLREAVDHLRYAAAQARLKFAAPRLLKGPTGEENALSLHGRGVFAAISPWNFPLAIFTGQIAGALAAGNAVVAKPAEQTPLVAARAVRLLHQAGVPPDVLHLLPGKGETVGAALVKDPRVDGVVFTGGTDTGIAINRALAARDGPIGKLIAETGGLNAMIVDSSALPEQVVDDALASAFDSAGQRCSALRVLFLQEDVADEMLRMLIGAARELKIGDPLDYATDVGPVIDEEARAALEAHKSRMRKEARELLDLPLSAEHAHGTYVAPAIYEIPSIAVLKREVFGPILHVVRFSGDRLGEVCEAINATGYRAHARAAQPHQGHGGLRGRAGQGRQYVCQPEPDRRRGRRPAVRRRGPVGHRAQGRRSRLSRGLRASSGCARPISPPPAAMPACSPPAATTPEGPIRHCSPGLKGPSIAWYLCSRSLPANGRAEGSSEDRQERGRRRAVLAGRGRRLPQRDAGSPARRLRPRPADLCHGRDHEPAALLGPCARASGRHVQGRQDGRRSRRAARLFPRLQRMPGVEMGRRSRRAGPADAARSRARAASRRSARCSAMHGARARPQRSMRWSMSAIAWRRMSTSCRSLRASLA